MTILLSLIRYSNYSYNFITFKGNHLIVFQIQSLYNKSLDRCAELEQAIQNISREKQNVEGELAHLTEQSTLSHREREGKEEELVIQLNELERRSAAQEQELDRAFETLAKREQESTMFLSALAMLTSTLIPSLNACSELAVQKNILQNEFTRLHRLKQQAWNLNTMSLFLYTIEYVVFNSLFHPSLHLLCRE